MLTLNIHKTAQFIQHNLILTGTTWIKQKVYSKCVRFPHITSKLETLLSPLIFILDLFFYCNCNSRTVNIVKDSSHLSKNLFNPLPSGKRFSSIHARTTRLSDSFNPVGCEASERRSPPCRPLQTHTKSLTPPSQLSCFILENTHTAADLGLVMLQNGTIPVAIFMFFVLLHLI